MPVATTSTSRGFTLIDAPIFTPAACEGTTTLFEVGYFDDKAYLTQSGQLYMEAGAMAFGKVYCFGPTFRAEKSKTRRHLTEFWMIEPEVAFADLDDDMALAEDFLVEVVGRVVEERAGRAGAPRARHRPARQGAEAVPAHHATRRRWRCSTPSGKPVAFGDDFGGDEETVLSEQFDRPVLVHRYPAASKAFYMKPDPADPRLALCVDVLAPEGYGEIIGGGQREDDLAALAAAHPRARPARGGVRVVPRPPPLRLGAARRFRHGHRAHGRVALRPPPRARDDSVSAHARATDALRSLQPPARIFA